MLKIFFDVDGVLIDGWHADEARRKPWDATIEDDLGVDRAAFQRLLFGVQDNRATSLMHDCISGRRDLKEVLADILPSSGYNGSMDAFVRYWFEKDSNVNLDVVKLVLQLRAAGAQTFLATGQEHYRADYLWSDLGFSKYFDDIFYSAKIGVSKKDKRFFEAINRSLAIDLAERPVFFDDQPQIVAVAAAAGWDATEFRSAADISDHPRLRPLLSDV